eukprot:1057413-Pelagomonas_calceolata.AAC.1
MVVQVVRSSRSRGMLVRMLVGRTPLSYPCAPWGMVRQRLGEAQPVPQWVATHQVRYRKIPLAP